MKWYEKVDYEMEQERQKFYDSLNWLEKIADDHLYFPLALLFVCVLCWWIGFLIGVLL